MCKTYDADHVWYNSYALFINRERLDSELHPIEAGRLPNDIDDDEVVCHVCRNSFHLYQLQSSLARNVCRRDINTVKLGRVHELTVW